MQAKIKNLLIAFSVLTLLASGLVALTVPVYAQRTVKSGGGNCPPGYIKLSVALQDGSDCVKESEGTDIKDNSIVVYMRNIIRFLSAGVGLVIVLMITVSGIQYITSQGDPQATAGAKNRLTNSIIALFLFIFMFAILNFLIPGGLISG